MSQHTLTRILGVLERQFDNRIDMSDWTGRPPDDAKKAFLSRAVAALCVKALAGIDADIAARSITDGFNDNGIDALFFDQKKDILFIAQSKWSDNGSKPLDAEGSNAFVAGARDLLAGKFDRFNEKIQSRSAEVRAFLYSERPIKIVLLTAHTAVQAISPHVRRKIDDLIDELNDVAEIAEAIHYDQSGLYTLITSESRPAKIKLQIGLKDWGVIERPFVAYYGRVHVDEISQWWKLHRNALFAENLRLFYLNSDVNNALRKTLTTVPEFFWYLNNGITVICDHVVKAAVGSPGRQIGLFTCEGANIVNGAQTVGSIGNSGISERASATDEGSDVPQSWVQVKIISLEKCPPDFARTITRAANLQNAVGNREFAAMDPVQHRVATEFALDRRRYVYKQGESDPKGDEGCDIVEATQALACSASVALAVQAKREISTLWADTESAPYTELFNSKLGGPYLWRSVLIMRAVDDELQTLKQSNSPRASYIAIHLNRIILHLVFQDSAVQSLRHDNSDEKTCLHSVRESAKRIFARVADYIEKVHPEDYLASLCKNLSKCEQLANVLLGRTNVNTGGGQGTLF
jgi:AIPR protein